MKRFIAFLLLAFCSVSAIGQEQIALSATQHFRPRWVQGNNPRQQLTNLLSSDGATVADYQPGNYTGTLNASAWLNSIGAAPSLAQASGAAKPIILPFSGQKYLANFGVNGNTASTPATGTNTFGGDLSFFAKLNFTSLTTTQGIGSQANSSGQKNWSLYLNSTGVLRYNYYTDGSTAVTLVSTATLASVGIAVGQDVMIGVYHDVDNGASGNDVKFYWWLPGGTPTQLGTTVTTSGAVTRHSSTDPITVGALTSTTTVFNGKIYRASLYSGNYFAGTGTLVADFNASDWPETTTNGATAVSSTTGETWTLANTGTLLAQIVGSPQLVFDGAAMYMQMTATIPAPYFAIEVANYITWTSTDVMADGKTSNSFAAQQITGTPQVKMYDGTSLTASVSPVLNTYNIISAGQDGSGNATVQLNAGTAATGTLNHTALAGWTEGANGAATKFGNKQIKERIILSAVPSAAKLANILNLLNQIYHLYAPYVGATDWLGDPMWRYAANDDYYRKVANK